jgi:hypothetical protein
MSDAPGLSWIVYNVAGVLAGFMIADARGQTPPPNDPPQVQTEGQAPSENLSDRLDRDKGVIRPKGDVDPDIRVAPPDGTPGRMPVIPPPGSPGGDQRVQPK